jgi:hypothetical protein
MNPSYPSPLVGEGRVRGLIIFNTLSLIPAHDERGDPI